MTMMGSCVCVCGEQNGIEVNGKCVMLGRTLIVRATILGGIGVIQQTASQLSRSPPHESFS